MASFGVWVWAKKSRAAANILVGTLALIFAFWITAPWVAGLGMGWRYEALVWYMVYVATLSFGPALCVQASSLIARQQVPMRLALAYAWSSVVSVAIITGTILQKFGFNQTVGSALLNVAFVLGLLSYAVVLLWILWDHYPNLFGRKHEDMESYAAVVLFLLFLSSGSLQMAFGSLAVQPIVALLSFVFFIVGVSSAVRIGFLGVSLHPLEGFFLAIIGASAVLLLHSSDQFEFWVSLVAIGLVALYGRLAIVMVAREHERGEHIAQLNRELREIDEARNDFTSMVAHQLRSPIGGMRAAAVALRDGTFGVLPSSADEIVGLIVNSSDRLLNLAETYLKGVRLHQGRFVAKPSPTDVPELLRTVAREFAPLGALKGLKIECDPGNVPHMLVLDGEILMNSLFNLTDNAIKYTERGRISIKADWRLGILNVSVSDTGAGMTQKELTTAFDRYVRGSAARARQVAGTGLGLYIVKRLLHAVGGTIRARSRGLGQGSVFELSMPAYVVDASRPAK